MIFIGLTFYKDFLLAILIKLPMLKIKLLLRFILHFLSATVPHKRKKIMHCS